MIAIALILAVLSFGCGSDGMGISDSGDADGDGLTNGEEATLGTDPFDTDSDRDGIEDGDEVDLDRLFNVDGTTTTAPSCSM